MKKRNKKKIRFQLDLTESEAADLLQMVSSRDCRSRTELLRLLVREAREDSMLRAQLRRYLEDGWELCLKKNGIEAPVIILK